LLAGAPSPDVAALREIMALDENIVLTSITQKAVGATYENASLGDLDNFDAIILAGYPGRDTDPGEVTRIAESDKPLIFLLDRGTNLRLVRERLGDNIPVTLRTVRPGFVDAVAVLNAAGRAHPVLNIRNVSLDLGRLPPLSYSQSLWQPTPDARTLATVTVRGIALDDPLLVVRSRGRLRSAALLGSGLWRWRNVPEDLEDLERVVPELLSNLLQWVTTRSDDRPVRVAPVADFFDGGDVVQFSGQIYDESLNPVDGAAVVITVTDPDGGAFEYPMDAISHGRYSKRLGRLREGTYRYRVTAEAEGADLGSDAGQFTVGRLTLEYRDTRADAGLMRQISRRSGGTTVSLSGIDLLIETLTARIDANPDEVSQVTELPLRRVLPLLFVVIALLATEWIVRKRSGMV